MPTVLCYPLEKKPFYLLFIFISFWITTMTITHLSATKTKTTLVKAESPILNDQNNPNIQEKLTFKKEPILENLLEAPLLENNKDAIDVNLDEIKPQNFDLKTDEKTPVLPNDKNDHYTEVFEQATETEVTTLLAQGFILLLIFLSNLFTYILSFIAIVLFIFSNFKMDKYAGFYISNMRFYAIYIGLLKITVYVLDMYTPENVLVSVKPIGLILQIIILIVFYIWGGVVKAEMQKDAFEGQINVPIDVEIGKSYGGYN